MESLEEFMALGAEYLEKLPPAPTKHYISDWLIAHITNILLENGYDLNVEE